jgi:hypothetical protein
VIRIDVPQSDVRATAARLREQYPDAWVIAEPSVLSGTYIVTVWED